MQAYEVLNGVSYPNIMNSDPRVGELNYIFSSAKAEREGGLKIALVTFGIIFIFGIVTMMYLFPSAWGWKPRQPEYEQMIMGIYAALGVFLIRAAKDPLSSINLILFTILSSLIHGGIMLIQAIIDKSERAHFFGYIPSLFIVAIVLWYLIPKKDNELI